MGTPGGDWPPAQRAPRNRLYRFARHGLLRDRAANGRTTWMSQETTAGR